jgi:nucleoside 2-deoxyribosyltransferase
VRVYIGGSLREQNVPEAASALRQACTGVEVFDDWYAAGPKADDCWKEYEQHRERSYTEALNGYAAKNVFAFDKRNIEAADIFVLVLPAGKSGHLELGWAIGKGKKGIILLDKDDVRWDVMYQFADLVTDDIDDVARCINLFPKGKIPVYVAGETYWDQKVTDGPFKGCTNQQAFDMMRG